MATPDGVAAPSPPPVADEPYARRRRVYLRYGGCCTYCGRVLRLEDTRMDHDVRGAAWVDVPESALVCACARCHEDKGQRTREEYRAHRRMMLARQMLASLAGA